MKRILVPLFTLFLFSCGDEALPKPKAYLRLEYPSASYNKEITTLPFSFEKNSTLATTIDTKTDPDGVRGLTLKYPELKGTIYMTYKSVEDNTLMDLLRDAQNLTQKHTVKADEIVTTLYENPEKRVFGMYYEIGGNAASQAQFYLTDSLKHFVNGSLYFYAKPNYDSLYPASEYLKKDIRHIMESLEWKE